MQDLLGQYTLEMFSASDIRIENNQWIDCGNGTPTSSAIRMRNPDTHRITLARNTFASPGRRTARAVVTWPAGLLRVGGNVFAPDNQLKDGVAGVSTPAR